VLYLDEPLVDGTPVASAVTAADASAARPISVVDQTAGTPEPTLCQSLLRGG